MYIPSLLFGAQNLCVSASGGDEVGEFISGSYIWKYHKYTSLGSGSFTIHSGSTNDARILLVAGGGAGGRTSIVYPGGSPRGAGGGGAGGVVFLPYRLGTGEYTLYVGDGGIHYPTSSADGEDSWIKAEYAPSGFDSPWFPTASQLTAEGGGRGAFLQWNIPYGNGANGGGSGGGAAYGLTNGGHVGKPANGGRTGQGSDGGDVDLTYGIYWDGGAGGGGASTTGSDVNSYFTATKSGKGGDGVLLNVDGSGSYYAGGGTGCGENNWTGYSLGYDSWGAGGWGSNDSSGGDPTPSSLRDGKQGIIVIMYPVCPVNCTTYAVDGGSNGGNFTFVPCNSSSIETITLDPLDKITVCSYPIPQGQYQYPSASGDVSYVATGSCNLYEIPPNPDSCPTGSTLEPLYQTEVVVSAPPVHPYPGEICLSWDDYLGNRQAQCVGTGTYYYCAISGSLTVDLYTVGSSWTITHTATQCGYYCSSSV